MLDLIFLDATRVHEHLCTDLVPLVVSPHVVLSLGHLKAYSRHLGVFGAVLKCHLVGRFNTGGTWRHLERYFFVTEWRFFAD